MGSERHWRGRLGSLWPLPTARNGNLPLSNPSDRTKVSYLGEHESYAHFSPYVARRPVKDRFIPCSQHLLQRRYRSKPLTRAASVHVDRRGTEMTTMVWATQQVCGSTSTFYALLFYAQAGFHVHGAFSLTCGCTEYQYAPHTLLVPPARGRMPPSLPPW